MSLVNLFHIVLTDFSLKTHRDVAGPGCQHVVIAEFLCMLSSCALGTDVCHWMFKTKVNVVQGQEDAPLI